MGPSPRALVVLTTAGSEEQANQLAEALVGRRHAGCVNIVPAVRSIYRWRGAVQRESEWLLVIKTLDSAYDDLAATLRELHTYETPEIVALPIERSDAKYLNWLISEVPAPA
jgi:periplasmic divalent cation tolerance protein